MQRVDSVEAMAAAGGGAYVVRRRFVYALVSPELTSVAAWGHVRPEDAEELAAVLDRLDALGLPPHASLVQFQRLRGVEEAAVARIAALIEPRLDLQARLVTREAVVRPPGPLGMTVAGFWDVMNAPFPVRVFDAPLPALDWLGFPAGRAAAWLAALDRAVEEAAAQDDAVHALRDLLATEHRALDVAAAARRLGLSERTLQRRLGAAGTTFQRELTLARVGAAELLLRTTDLDIKAIAYQVGAASPQSFSQTFRQATGLSPAAYRAKHRAG